MPNLAKRFIPHFLRILPALLLLVFANVAHAQGISITPATLPDGMVGSTYAQELIASSAQAPVQFTITAGTLPTGLRLGTMTGDRFATIGGVPMGTPGPSTFTVQVTDSSTPPQTASATYTLTIDAADTTDDAELKGVYAFLFQGFEDSDGTMVVVAASFGADGQGNITVGFEDTLESGAPEPTREVTGNYWLGADGRGTMFLTTDATNPATGVLFAFSAGNIQNGVFTKARLIRFDDTDGLTGSTGSGVMLMQNPATFMLSALTGSYAFSEIGSSLTSGNPESGVGLEIFDGKGNFLLGSMVDLNSAGALTPTAAISGTYALSNETVSNGRLTASPVITGDSGTVSDVFYIIDDTQFFFLSSDSTNNTIYSGTAQLQVPPANGFAASSLTGNSVIAVQGKPSSGLSTAVIGSLTATSPNFTLEFVQRGAGDSSQVTGTAGGTYTVGENGRAVLTFTSGGFSPTILYLDAVNQGFAGETDAGASTGLIAPGGSNFSNETLSGSGNYFFGSFNPAMIQGRNQVGVGSASPTSLQFTSDATGPAGVLFANAQATQPSPYTVAPNGQFTSSDNGVAGYVASACLVEAIVGTDAGSGIASVECQGTAQVNETLTVAVTGGGTVTSDPAAINCPETCSSNFTQDEHVTLTATPNADATFTSFSSNCALANPPTNPPSCTVTMRTAQTVTATFSGATTNFNLTVTPEGTGTGTVTSAPAGINCGATCSAPFASGTQVTLTAAPATGSTFTGWGAPCSGTGTCVVTLTAATTVTATFALSANNFTLTVTKAGTGTGTVTSAPAGINCGATCAAPFASGTQITLTSAPTAGSTFTGWGAPCQGTGTCVITIAAATAVTAMFTLSTTNFALTVTEAGTGTGTVMSTPAGIACQPTCIANFASGQVVALSATAAAGSTFAGWSGAGCSGTAGCSVTMTAAQAVTATFTKSATNVALTVTETGTGTGTVTSTPAGIACQPTCVANLASGQVVALTATAAAGSTFAGWTGAGPCEGTEVCMFDITVTTSVTANFTKNVTNVTLTVAETGTGTGTVNSAPAGIACQPTCSASFASGQAVALTATAAAGSTFAGWSGAGCSGTAGCSVTLTAATTVTAMFNKSTTNFTLTVTETGAGTGTVTSAPGGIACQPMCSASFASGQVVALTATAAEGSTFAGWSGGGCNGTGGCSVTVTAATAVTATFNSNNSPVTITVKPGTPSTVSTTPGGGAVFGLLLSSVPGTTGSVMLGCTSSSPDITCQIVPNTITLNGKGTEVAIVVNTFCTAAAPGPMPGQFPRGTPGGFGLLLAALSLVLCGATWKMKSQPRWAISFAALILMTVGMSACASLPKSPGGQATPPGNYPLVVTATAPNGSTSSVNLTLTVLP
jgi:hypothetical protein